MTRRIFQQQISKELVALMKTTNTAILIISKCLVDKKKFDVGQIRMASIEKELKLIVVIRLWGLYGTNYDNTSSFYMQ